MEILHRFFAPFLDMVALPDLFFRVFGMVLLGELFMHYLL